MNYTLHQLQIFLEVVRNESVTRAAEKLNMTQPALSIQLKNFQYQFKTPLTEVVGRRIFITDFGKDIAKLAENVVREAEEIKYKTYEYDGLFAGKLSISSASTGKYVLPYFLHHFLGKHPGVDLNLDVTNKIRTLERLKNHEVEIALVSVVPEGMDVEEEILLENKLFLVGDTPEFDIGRPFIFREEGSATRLAMDQFLSQTKSRKQFQLTSNEAVKQAVIAGLGYSVIPLIGMKNELMNKDLFILPSEGLPITTYWRLIWLRNKKLSPISRAFLSEIRESKTAIIKTHFSWYQDFTSPEIEPVNHK